MRERELVLMKIEQMRKLRKDGERERERAEQRGEREGESSLISFLEEFVLGKTSKYNQRESLMRKE